MKFQWMTIESKGEEMPVSGRTCAAYECGQGLITVETRGPTFQHDHQHTRLAHLRDFELWSETAIGGALQLGQGEIADIVNISLGRAVHIDDLSD